MTDVFDRLEAFAAKLDRAGWEQIWQVTDKWWMVGFQRKKSFIIAAVIDDRLRVFAPTNQTCPLDRKVKK